MKIDFLAPSFDTFSLPPLRTVQFGVLLFLPPCLADVSVFSNLVCQSLVCVCKHKCFTPRPQKRTDTPLSYTLEENLIYDFCMDWFVRRFFSFGGLSDWQAHQKKSCPPPSLSQSSSRTTTGLILAISAETPFFRSWISFHFLPRTLLYA